MASEIRVNSITNRSGLSTVTFSDTGVILSGVSTFSSGIIVSAGSTITPAVSPSGDSNTGIFFPAADTIAFAEGGTEALRINSSANIGIGTTNPISNLHIYSGSGTLTKDIVLIKGGGGSGNYNGLSVQANNNDSIFSVNNLTYNVTMCNVSGSVGIGTAVPTQKLEVVGGEIKAGRVDTSQEGGQFSLARSTDNATAWYLDVYGNTSTPQLRFVDVSNASVRASIDSSGNFTLNSGNIVIGTAGKGIDFSATANSSGTMTSELLADYEEGTWSPTLTASSNCSSVSLNGTAWYIKIGKLVTYSLTVNLTVTTTATKTAFIMTLPFVQSSTSDKQGGSATLEGPNPFPIASGGIVDASSGTSDAFVTWGSSSINFTGSSLAYLTGSFKAD
jgi:hypothetical protein